MFPENLSRQCLYNLPLHENIVVEQIPGTTTVKFSMYGLTRTMTGDLSRSQVLSLSGTSPGGEAAGTSPIPLLKTLVQLAFALLPRSADQPVRPEPVLLLGPTSYKSFVVAMFARIAFRYPAYAMRVLPLSPLTETAGLLGAVQPFSWGGLLLSIATTARDAAARRLAKASLVPGLSQLCEKLSRAYTEMGLSQGTEDIRDYEEELLRMLSKPAVQALLPNKQQVLLKDLASRTTAEKKAEPLYIFRDGPVVDAMHSGGRLVLDNVQFADSAVLERLNPWLETDKTMITLSEDPMFEGLGEASQPPWIVTIAHTEHASADFAVSAPAASRLTRIRVEAYSSHDLDIVVKAMTYSEASNLQLPGEQTSARMVDLFRKVRSHLNDALTVTLAAAWTRFLRVPLSVAVFPESLLVPATLLLGARLLFQHSLHLTSASAVVYELLSALSIPPNVKGYDALVGIFRSPEKNHLEVPYLLDSSGRSYVKFLGIILPTDEKIELPSDLVMVPSLLLNICIGLCAAYTGNRVLLSGDCTGKSLCVREVTRLLGAGTDPVHVNFTSATTEQELLGSFAPAKGKRFEWQDSELVKAFSSARLEPQATPVTPRRPFYVQATLERLLHPRSAPRPSQVQPKRVVVCLEDVNLSPAKVQLLLARFVDSRHPGLLLDDKPNSVNPAETPLIATCTVAGVCCVFPFARKLLENDLTPYIGIPCLCLSFLRCHSQRWLSGSILPSSPTSLP